MDNSPILNNNSDASKKHMWVIESPSLHATLFRLKEDQTNVHNINILNGAGNFDDKKNSA